MAEVIIKEVKLVDPEKCRLVVKILSTGEGLADLKKKGQKLRDALFAKRKEMNSKVSSLMDRLELFVVHLECLLTEKEQVIEAIIEVAESKDMRVSRGVMR